VYPPEHKHIAVARKIMAQFCKEVTETYGFKCNGSGGELMKDVSGITLSFSVRGQYTPEEVRPIYVTLFEKLLKTLNENEELQPFLNPNPFTRENIELSFGFRAKGREKIEDGPVAHAFYARNRIFYSTYDTFERHLKRIWSEPYEAALAVVRGERPDDLRELYGPNGTLLSPRVVVMRAFFGNARKKYDFRSRGGDIERRFNMEEMIIIFNSPKEMIPKEARAILTELVDDLWSRVGETKAVREGLTKEEFINEHLLLAILFEDKWGYTRRKGLSDITLENGVVTYIIDDQKTEEPWF
jgi:hypothetical protein